MNMNFLINAIAELEQFKELNSAVRPRSSAAASGLTCVHKSNLIAALCRKRNSRAICIACDEQEAQTFCNDLNAIGLRSYVYPAKDFTFRDVDGRSKEYEHIRLGILRKMLDGEYDVIVTCTDAAAQYTVPKDILSDSVVTIKTAQSIGLERCVKALALLGYERTYQVEGVGQFSVRGGILDFFSPDYENPVRVDFWGDDVDSISLFDITTQRRTDALDEVTLSPSSEILISDRSALAAKIVKKANLLKTKQSQKAKAILVSEAEKIEKGVHIGNLDKFIGLIYDSPATLFDYAGNASLIFVSENSKVRERMRAHELRFNQEFEDYFANGVLCRGFDKYSTNRDEYIDFLKSRSTVFLDNFTHGNYDLPLNALVSFSVKQLSVWNGSASILTEDLESFWNSTQRCAVLAGTKKAAQNLAQDLREKGFPAEYTESPQNVPKGTIYVTQGALSAGFEYPQTGFHLISHGFAFYGSEKRIKKKSANAQSVSSLSELAAGDYVVHSTHGIGIFGGVVKIESQGITKDYLKITYAKGDNLYVPVTQLDLISKYIGPHENGAVKIHRLGGTEWQKTKARVRSAVKDIAKELTKLYAERMNTKGYAFSGETPWQEDFECKFEFEDTPDQKRCTEEIKHDMEQTAPMDRLLCGDVGFGKTEVALRAAFKCCCDSKQCAFLCPTTILAWQHYQTVLKRFDGYPIRVELLSRFKTAQEQKVILDKLAKGEVDMVVGTHRIISKDVVFRDLGLVIIDEEQRFGVAQKERFKEICRNVDVLSLSATPIPRTLNMAMTGIRDMSVLEEAPMNRRPVQTYVMEHDTAVINDAVRRELRRGGQVFYLHNRVETIERCASKLSEQIPEAKIAIAHGKMSETELSEVWRRMLEQEINVLVCTTIIETGVDLPNANTLIIENADHMGLSQLHQLRGRVGRSNRRAYAYFTFAPQKVLTEISQKRLTAIREFTEFGSGFKIAMRDLELRGAGNILGAQQHGHMENVGYDMYLKLLGEAISEEKGEKTEENKADCIVDIAVEAHIPEYYIENLSQRLDVYKRIADIRTDKDSEDVIDELIDRFGEIPPSVLGLVDVALVRNRAAAMGIYEIKQFDRKLVLCIQSVNVLESGELLDRMKGRGVLSLGDKPHFTIELPKNITTLRMLTNIFTDRNRK